MRNVTNSKPCQVPPAYSKFKIRRRSWQFVLLSLLHTHIMRSLFDAARVDSEQGLISFASKQWARLMMFAIACSNFNFSKSDKNLADTANHLKNPPPSPLKTPKEHRKRNFSRAASTTSSKTNSNPVHRSNYN